MPNPLGDWLLRQGFDGQTVVLVTTAAQVVLVLVLAVIADRVAKRVVVRGLETVFRGSASVWDDIIVKRRLLHRLSHLAPARWSSTCSPSRCSTGTTSPYSSSGESRSST